MKNVKIYDFIKKLLERDPDLRGSDKKLFWEILERRGHLNASCLTRGEFLKAPSFETISRARRKVQENHPELLPTRSVTNRRKYIQKQKGTHVYRELF